MIRSYEYELWTCGYECDLLLPLNGLLLYENVALYLSQTTERGKANSDCCGTFLTPGNHTGELNSEKRLTQFSDFA